MDLRGRFQKPLTAWTRRGPIDSDVEWCDAFAYVSWTPAVQLHSESCAEAQHYRLVVQPVECCRSREMTQVWNRLIYPAWKIPPPHSNAGWGRWFYWDGKWTWLSIGPVQLSVSLFHSLHHSDVGVFLRGMLKLMLGLVSPERTKIMLAISITVAGEPSIKIPSRTCTMRRGSWADGSDSTAPAVSRWTDYICT